MLTGVTAKDKDAAPAPKEPTWSVEQLKAGKPLLVYYYAEVTKPTDEYYKFASKFEQGTLLDRNIERINKSWRATKRTVDPEADRKVEKNQVRLEFWSFTGKKIGVVTLKNMAQVFDGPQTLANKLAEMERTNRALCDAEIKRMQTAGEREEANAGK